MVSFVIPAHNESALIGATLDALHIAAAAACLDYEVVVVDDASDDSTATIARARHARVITVAHRHIAAARNAGARATSGARLVFVDADTHVNVDVVTAAILALEAGASGGGATVRLLGPLSWHERLAIGVFVRLLRMARIAPGCFLFCSRAAFDAVGGFDETYFAGEDVAISRALRRYGRFVLLRETVATSERKLRTFTPSDHLRLLWRLLWRGRAMLRSRDALDLWYGERRQDPKL